MDVRIHLRRESLCVFFCHHFIALIIASYYYILYFKCFHFTIRHSMNQLQSMALSLHINLSAAQVDDDPSSIRKNHAYLDHFSFVSFDDQNIVRAPVHRYSFTHHRIHLLNVRTRQPQVHPNASGRNVREDQNGESLPASQRKSIHHVTMVHRRQMVQKKTRKHAETSLETTNQSHSNRTSRTEKKQMREERLTNGQL